jgi:uncharacterized membrane protein
MLDVLLKQPKNKSSLKEDDNDYDNQDKPIKSLIKTVSWRIIGTLDTIIISYFITGTLTAALSIGTVEVISKTILYYFHERMWANINKLKLRKQIKSNGKQYNVSRVERPAFRKVS